MNRRLKLVCVLVTCLLAAAEPRKAEPLTGVKIWSTYENEAAGDDQYLGKTLEVGQIGGPGSGINKTPNGAWQVTALCVDRAAPGRTPNLYFALKVGDEAARKQLAAAKPGAVFTLKGVCKGKKSDAKAWGGYAVTFEDCEITAVWSPGDK